MHGRQLTTTTVSSTTDLVAAINNIAVSKIVLQEGTYEFSSSMCTDSALCINRDVTIEAQVPGSVVLDAKGTSSSQRRVFNIQSSCVATLIGLSITGGYVTSVGLGGGGLRIDGTATLSNCSIYGNTAGEHANTNAHTGGGLAIGGSGEATLTDCNVYQNTANYVYAGGGGLRIDGTATLINCEIYGNTAAGWRSGGGLNVVGTATLTNCNVYQNTVTNTADRGGGMFIFGIVTLSNCNMFGNTAPKIWLLSGTLTLVGTTWASFTGAHKAGGTIIEASPPFTPPSLPPLLHMFQHT